MNVYTGLNPLRDKAHSIAIGNGEWDPEEHEGLFIGPTFGDLIASLHSDAAGTLRAYQNGVHPAEFRYTFRSTDRARGICSSSSDDGKIWCWTGEGDPTTDLPPYGADWVELTPASAEELGYQCRPVGVPAALATLLIRIADICGRYEIDLEAAVAEVMQFNETRPI